VDLGVAGSSPVSHPVSSPLTRDVSGLLFLPGEDVSSKVALFIGRHSPRWCWGQPAATGVVRATISIPFQASATTLSRALSCLRICCRACLATTLCPRSIVSNFAINTADLTPENRSGSIVKLWARRLQEGELRTAKKRFHAEQIIGTLREAKVEVCEGRTIGHVVKQLPYY
jgi:hypothetical protein